jgi:hypothetical protein
LTQARPILSAGDVIGFTKRGIPVELLMRRG